MNVGLKVGDKVAYSVEWLHSVGCITGELPAARGTVIALENVSDDFVLATIDWHKKDFPAKVNVKNLARVGLNLKFSKC